MTLEDLAQAVPNFASLNHADKIKLFVWWLHSHDAKAYVQPKDVGACYAKLRISPPADMGSFFRSFTERSPKQLLKSSEGYALERGISDGFTTKYGQRASTIQLVKLLTELPGKLANPAERSYLDETLVCLRYKAFRAAVVMAWNLAYDHLCHWILADKARVAAFNVQQAKTYAKRNYPPIANRDSFEDMKEFEVIQVLASAGLINGATETVLKQKLDRRNKAAHPSGITITQLNAEDAISDLIENVVLRLK